MQNHPTRDSGENDTTRPPELSTIDIGDAQMHYLDYGGGGPALVLLHATGFLPFLWHPIAAALSKDHRVIAPAFYDHRPAAPNAGGLGWLQLADDLARICSRLRLEKPLLAGHSMGAVVGMLANAVYATAAAGLILIEPIFLPSETYRTPISLAQHPLAAQAIKRRNHWPDRRSVWEDFNAKPFFQSWNPEMLSLYVHYGTRRAGSGGVTLTCTPDQEASLFIGGMQHDPWPELSKVTCPTLVVEGEVSENRFYIDLRHAADMIPQGRYTSVPGAGHLIPMEKPVQTIRLIRSFIDSLPSSDSSGR